MTDPLAVLIAELRHELAAETPIRLHLSSRGSSFRSTRRGSSDSDQSHSSGGTTWHTEVGATYGTQVGLPFTPAFERRLSHRDNWGIGELAHASLGEVADHCRSRHSSDLHRSPGRPTSLCERIARGLTEFGQPLEAIARREGLDPETTYALAVQALRHAAAYRHRELHRYLR